MTRMRAFIGFALLAGACRGGPPTPEPVALPGTPREEYVHRLQDAGLGESALLRDWSVAAEAALLQPVRVPAAFREAALIEQSATAHAYRIPVRRGQRVTVDVDIDSDADTHVFIDAFAEIAEHESELYVLGHAEADERTLSVEPRADGAVVVRVQPELLRSGRVTVEIAVRPTLEFPVASHGMPDVGSVFGDPRDAGARSHHGIDIFAPRGTPVIAATEGTVSRVQETARGGRVVWLRDSQRSQSLYYAHLDSQLVTRGTRVQVGDTLGLVGNTGNARTTPPHLHFGIYSRGPVDPVPFVRPVRADPPALSDDTALVGRWIRTAAAETSLREAPASDAATTVRLPRSTAMHVLAANAAWLRVRLPDGSMGFVAARGTEGTDAPLRSTILADVAEIRSHPAIGAPVVDRLARGQRLDVQGRFGPFLLVRTDEGARGWLAEADSD